MEDDRSNDNRAHDDTGMQKQPEHAAVLTSRPTNSELSLAMNGQSSEKETTDDTHRDDDDPPSSDYDLMSALTNSAVPSSSKSVPEEVIPSTVGEAEEQQQTKVTSQDKHTPDDSNILPLACPDASSRSVSRSQERVGTRGEDESNSPAQDCSDFSHDCSDFSRETGVCVVCHPGLAPMQHEEDEEDDNTTLLMRGQTALNSSEEAAGFDMGGSHWSPCPEATGSIPVVSAQEKSSHLVSHQANESNSLDTTLSGASRLKKRKLDDAFQSMAASPPSTHQQNKHELEDIKYEEQDEPEGGHDEDTEEEGYDVFHATRSETSTESQSEEMANDTPLMVSSESATNSPIVDEKDGQEEQNIFCLPVNKSPEVIDLTADDDEEEEELEEELEEEVGQKVPAAAAASDEDDKKPAAKEHNQCSHCSKIFTSNRGLEYHVKNFVCRPQSRPGGPVKRGRKKLDSSTGKATSSDGEPSSMNADSTTPIPDKQGRSNRCDACAGCLRPQCGLCSYCKNQMYATRCAFRPCINHCNSTLENLRRAAKRVFDGRSDGAQGPLDSAFEALYGEDSLITKKIVAMSTTTCNKAGCGSCSGCKRERCSVCRPCKKVSCHTKCAFKLCSNYPYAASTVANYRDYATEAIETTDSSELSDTLVSLFDAIYGDDGWALKLINKDEAAKISPSAQNSQVAETDQTLEAGKKRTSRCGKCRGCMTKICGHCRPCRGDMSRHMACAFCPCQNYASRTLTNYRGIAKETTERLRKKNGKSPLDSIFEETYGEHGWVSQVSSLSQRKLDANTFQRSEAVHVGTRVYCVWPENETWYWGKILSVVQTKDGDVLYSIRFDDGDTRTNVPAWDFVTETEYMENNSEQPDRKRRRTDTAAWSSTEEKAVSVSAVPSSVCNLQVGSRCYAKFTNGQWYWGRVEQVNGRGKSRLFSVKFDDGDFLQGVPTYDIVSEEEYNEEMGNLPANSEASHPNSAETDSDVAGPRSLATLRKERCRCCSMCSKKDCGECQSCVTNQRQTDTGKEVCLHKICSRFPVRQKIQRLAGSLKDFSYYILETAELPMQLRGCRRAHPDLEGLVVVSPSGKKHRTLESAAKSSRFSVKDLCDDIVSFYQVTLGVKMEEEIQHELVGKGFHREWLDYKGNKKEVFGRITKCKKHLLDGSLHFSVTFDNTNLARLKAVAFLNEGVPSICEKVSKADAWGGYFSYAEATDTDIESPTAKKVPFHHRYIVPTTRYEDRLSSENGLPVLVLYVKGFCLELEACQSDIPNAGLGLWAKCTPLSPQSEKKCLELKKGELVDLGVYAPLLPQDCKREHISLLKNFLHCWDCESWLYDANMSRFDVFDITDDKTGSLHEVACSNILVYANETDGQETPSIWATHDPEGAVHYHLGHSSDDQGLLRFPADGRPVELKIDYGPKYEPVRIRKGYSRLEGEDLRLKQQTILKDDTDLIRDMQESSVSEIHQSVEFLESVFASYSATSAGEIKQVERALIAALVLQRRLQVICTQFEIMEDNNEEASVCDNGYSKMEEDGTEGRLRSLISHLCNLFPHGSDQMRACLLSDDMYRSVLAQSLHLADMNELENLSGRQLLNHIVAASE